MSTVQAPPAPGLRTSPLTLAVVCAGYLMVITDATVVNVALPAIGRELHGGVTGLAWVVDGYTLSFAALLLSGGSLAERLGGRRGFALGLVAFAAASAACGLAPGLRVLVAARVAQGAGAALLVPSSLTLLQAAYPTRRQRQRALGVWGAVAGTGAAAGPVLGGLLVSTWSWRAVFFVNLPVALAAFGPGRRFLPAAARVARGVRGLRGLDPAGQILALAALGLLTAALVEAGRLGPGSPLVLCGAGLAVAAGAGFVLAERRADEPMLPLELLGRRGLRAGSAVGLLINLGFYGQLFVMSLYFQDVRGYSALATGLALAPEAALLVLASTLSGRIMARTGPRLPMLAGLLLGGAGLAALAFLVTAGVSYGLLVAPLAVAGFGMAMTMPAATSAVLEAAPAGRAGIAAGVVNASRQVGSVLGVAAAGTLMSWHSFLAGLHGGLIVAAAAFWGGAVVTFLGIRARG